MNDGLLSELLKASSEVNKKSVTGSGNWVITNATIANAINNLLVNKREIRKSKISSIYE